MNIFEATINDKEAWENFVKENETGSFLQSWQWADFTSSLHDKGWRFLIKEENEIVGLLFCVKKRIKLKQSQISCPRGPVLKNNLSEEKQKQVLDIIIKKIDELAKTENAMLFQMDPLIKNSNKVWHKLMADFHLVQANRNDQPKYTLILNLDKDEDDLLKQMHSKTRYNIRLAQKKGVKITVDNSRLDDFYQMLKKTERRQKVKFFSKKYFDQILKLDFVKLYLAEFDNKIIAANIMVFYNDMATYLFGGTDNDFRKIMAPHLLQWQAILDAQKFGCNKYDFWGAAPANVTGHEKKWAGVTRFKKSFCLQNDIVEYLGTYEKKYQPVKLLMYRLLQKIFA